jgi:hypothetical protein
MGISVLGKFQPGTSTVAITAYGSKGFHRMAYEMGATVSLEKTVYIDELRNLIR